MAISYGQRIQDTVRDPARQRRIEAQKMVDEWIRIIDAVPVVVVVVVVGWLVLQEWKEKKAREPR